LLSCQDEWEEVEEEEVDSHRADKEREARIKLIAKVNYMVFTYSVQFHCLSQWFMRIRIQLLKKMLIQIQLKK
jgi:hypothetical protein